MFILVAQLVLLLSLIYTFHIILGQTNMINDLHFIPKTPRSWTKISPTEIFPKDYWDQIKIKESLDLIYKLRDVDLTSKPNM